MKYPYIQGKKKTVGTCELCKEVGSISRIEWRVNWFQGDCEFEDICSSCLSKRERTERQKQREYEKKMEPVWEKQRIKEKETLTKFETLLSENNIVVKKYSNGQWSFDKVLDWWETTGTAIARKSRKGYQLSIKRPEEIIKLINNLKK